MCLAFLIGEGYLAEQFRQLTHYLAEQFRQIVHYLEEQLILEKLILYAWKSVNFVTWQFKG